MLYDNPAGLARVILVGITSYVGLVLILRITGKRALAKLNAFDFVVTVALGSILATAVLSKDVTLLEGMLAFVVLATLQWVVSRASVASVWFKDLVRSEPRLLVSNGTYLDLAMDDERITRSEVDSAIRAAGIGRLDVVGAVVLEADGSLSVIRAEKDELTVLNGVRQ